MNYKKRLIIPLLSFALSTLSFATVYFDGEEGTVGDWYVYDNKPYGAMVDNVMDDAKNSKVVEFKGEGRFNSYRLGSKDWKNGTERTLKWSMKFSEKFKISVYLKTKKGRRTLLYVSNNKDRGFYRKKYIKFGLGKESMNGTWQNYSRNLEMDLKKYEPDNRLIQVRGIKVQGSGRMDDVELYDTNENVNQLKIDNILVEKQSDTFVKVSWSLNKNCTGQVEYGKTNSYGELTRKENSFNYRSHRQSLRGLEINTTYHYRVISEDKAGNRVVSEDKTFSTGMNKIFKFKRWSDSAILEDNRKIQVLFRKDKEENASIYYSLIFKDITQSDNSPIILEYKNSYRPSDDEYGFRHSKILLSDDGKKLYLWIEVYGEYGEGDIDLITYDISNLNQPVKLNKTYTLRGKVFILNNSRMFTKNYLMQGEGEDFEEEYALVHDMLKSTTTSKFHNVSNNDNDLRKSSDYYKLKNGDGNALNFYKPSVQVALHGKPYRVLEDVDQHGKTWDYVILDDHKRVEIVDYKNKVSIKVIEIDIFAENMIILENRLLVFNDSEYQYITIP